MLPWRFYANNQTLGLCPPIKRSSDLCPELVSLLPLKHRLDQAENATEWMNILHDASNSFGAAGLVDLVTETVHGSGTPGRYVAIVLDQLKQSRVEDASFAFCIMLRNAVTVLERKKMGIGACHAR